MNQRVNSIIASAISTEIEFTTARSGGSGGQHVNKVETKVVLRWNIASSTCLTEQEKLRLSEKLANKINNQNELILNDQSSRSQAKNKDLVIWKLTELVTNALKVPKKRKPTKPSKESQAKAKKAKQRRSEIKALRQKPKW